MMLSVERSQFACHTIHNSQINENNAESRIEQKKKHYLFLCISDINANPKGPIRWYVK